MYVLLPIKGLLLVCFPYFALKFFLLHLFIRIVNIWCSFMPVAAIAGIKNKHLEGYVILLSSGVGRHYWQHTLNHHLTCDPGNSSKMCRNIRADVGSQTVTYQVDTLALQAHLHHH
jgi:hypothetical protein